MNKEVLDNSKNLKDVNFIKNINLSNAKSVWGAVVTLLHKNNYMALFTACGDIREIKLENNVLLINIREEFLYNILTKEENLNKITTLLKQINNNLDLKFVFVNKQNNNIQVNLKRLTEVFGSNLEIKS